MTFLPAERGSSAALIARDDGVRLRLRSYDRTFAVPHDLAHFVAERTFGLQQGVWGSIAAGAMFESMTVVSGRLRHDSRRRSTALLRANQRELVLAEVLAGVLHQGLHHSNAALAYGLNQAWGALREGPCPYTPTEAHNGVAELAALAEQWTATTSEHGLHLTWPSRPPTGTREDPRRQSATQCRSRGAK